jgi:hypothetical protein
LPAGRKGSWGAPSVLVALLYGLAPDARGGGASLPGECTNTAVIIDWSKYCDRLLEVDADNAVFVGLGAGVGAAVFRWLVLTATRLLSGHPDYAACSPPSCSRGSAQPSSAGRCSASTRS